MIKKCLVCGKEFITYPSKIKLGRGKYCSKECCLQITNKILEENGEKTRFKKGRKNDNSKGWRYIKDRNGINKYKEIFKPEHLFSTKGGYVREHRIIMEQKIGRYLLKNEIVHHKDNNGLNNNIDNLELLNKRDHDRMNVNLNIHRRWLK